MSEAELNRNYMVGIYAGLHQAAMLIRAEASDWFEVRNDSLANEMRDLADKLEQLSKEAHPDYKKDKK